MHSVQAASIWLATFASIAFASTYSNSSVSTSPATSSSLDLAWLRSPQCTSSYNSYYSAHITTSTITHSPTVVTVAAGSTDTVWRGGPEYTITGPITTTLPVYYDDIPDGPYDASACCGVCSIYWQQVDVRYFPVPGASSGCLASVDPSWSTAQNPTYAQTRTPSNTGNIPIPFPTTTPAPVVRRDNNSELVYSVGPDGFTYTSPYIYVVFSTIEALDSCGPRGGFYTSLTWSFLPGQLSTVEGRGGPTNSFNLADLPCPPASVASADWYNYRPQDGDPYRPILAPMPQLWELDPLFKGCQVDIYEGLDPPFALQPQTELLITTTAANPTPTPPSPGTTADSPSPQITGSPTAGSGQQPVEGTSLGAEPQSSNHIGNSGPSSFTGPGPSPSTVNAPSPTTSHGDTNGSPNNDPAQDPRQSKTDPIVIGGQTVSIVSSAAIIGSQTLHPGSVITIGSNTISLSPSSSPVIVVDGSSTITPSPVAVVSQTTPIIIAGQTASQQANGNLVLGGQTLTAGGPAATIIGSQGVTEVLSVANNGGSLVVMSNGQSSTIAIGQQPTNGPGIGSQINSVWNGPQTTSTLSNGTVIATGAALGLKQGSKITLYSGIILMALIPAVLF